MITLIKDLFANDINRNIEEVIKVDQMWSRPPLKNACRRF